MKEKWRGKEKEEIESGRREEMKKEKGVRKDWVWIEKGKITITRKCLHIGGSNRLFSTFDDL